MECPGLPIRGVVMPPVVLVSVRAGVVPDLVGVEITTNGVIVETDAMKSGDGAP